MRLFLSLLCLTLFSCQHISPERPLQVKTTTEYFKDRRGCFALYSIKEKKLVQVINPERCAEATSPCSTFKIPLAVIAYDRQLITESNSLIKWDGKKRALDNWNKDQSATDWMANSTVWYSQVLTKKIGQKNLQKYMTDFRYGNEDFSGSIERAWLTPLKANSKSESLKISAFEQIDFMEKLWAKELPASPSAQSLAQKLLPLDMTSLGSKIYGKTGSGTFDLTNQARLGWYVAFVEGRDGKSYISVVTFDDITPAPEQGPGGPEARKIMKELLADYQL